MEENTTKIETKENELKTKVEKPIVKGTVKKQSNFSKVIKLFIVDDASTMKERLRDEVIIPAIKNVIAESIDSILFGVTGSKQRKITGSSAGMVAYNTIYNGIKNGTKQTKASESVDGRMVYDIKLIEFNNRRDAEVVIDCLCEMIDTYNVVSVADYYDLVGVTGKYTDNKYGWTSLQNATINRSCGVFTLVLPKVKPIN